MPLVWSGSEPQIREVVIVTRVDEPLESEPSPSEGTPDAAVGDGRGRVEHLHLRPIQWGPEVVSLGSARGSRQFSYHPLAQPVRRSRIRDCIESAKLLGILWIGFAIPSGAIGAAFNAATEAALVVPTILVAVILVVGLVETLVDAVLKGING